MKKLIAGLFLVLVLGGCSANAAVSTAEVAKAYSGDFYTEAKAAFGEATAEMSIEKKPMSISILLSSPGELAGMSIELFDEHALITYEGMTQELDTDNLPDGTVFLLIEELFDELSDPDEYILSTENGDLKAKADDFTAVLNPENFGLISAKFPRYSTEFTFGEFAFGSKP